MLWRASLRESPCDAHPGIDGQITEYPPSSSGSRITVNFIHTHDSRASARGSRRRSPDDVGGVLRHRPAEIAGIERSLLIDREPAQVTEVLDVEVGGQGADEPRRRVEGVGEGMRSARWHRHAGAGFRVDAIRAGREPQLVLGHDEHLIVVAVHMLGRPPGTRRQGRFDEAQAMPRVRLVLDDPDSDGTGARLLATVRPDDMDAHPALLPCDSTRITRAGSSAGVQLSPRLCHSHSIVPGGFVVMSLRLRLTSVTPLLA